MLYKINLKNKLLKEMKEHILKKIKEINKEEIKFLTQTPKICSLFKFSKIQKIFRTIHSLHNHHIYILYYTISSSVHCETIIFFILKFYFCPNGFKNNTKDF